MSKNNVVQFNPYGSRPPQIGSNEYLSATLRGVLKSPEKVVITEHGTDTKSLPWQPPPVITDAMRRDAVHTLGALKVRSQPASQAEADTFVAHLANMCAGRDFPPECKLAAAVSSILRAEYPAAIINDPAILDRVAKRLKAPGRPMWWPDWPELDAALAAERTELQEQWRRLEVIATGGKSGRRSAQDQDREEDRPRTEEEIARVRDCCASIGIPDPGAPIIKRMPGSRD